VATGHRGVVPHGTVMVSSGLVQAAASQRGEAVSGQWTRSGQGRSAGQGRQRDRELSVG